MNLTPDLISPEELQVAVEAERARNDAYWLSVIAQLADMQAATAGYYATLSRTSKSERKRQARICQFNLDVLEGRWPGRRDRTPADVAQRLRDTIQALEAQQ
ncbi:hypothetical protein DEIPH_ctg045orf0010 [Deinococcus phoenicis]|uniref:Uncharacterized protein n=1 Tax=Deinococcus phoenicis TaxID=1476583 RepID=A0A016QMQ8_9DEIO|nr:hypothetical protein [Deinococcus phoenicis]EYB67281.1 hypothetical protein DEIPH_ctg045orf0010 [Deinococcus phoenicis]